MTSSPDVVTSESSDINSSSNISVSLAETGIRSTANNVSAAIPTIVRVTILLTLNVCNLCGNGFTLITIRMTPRLWTKTNFILASMLVADVATAVVMFWYTSFILVVYVFGNPCRFNVVLTALTPLMKMTTFVSAYHLIVVSVERFVAIVYPLHYETMFSDRAMKLAISVAWATGIVISLSFAGTI